VFVALVENWQRDENYSHGFLVPPIAAYLVWTRRARLWATERRPAMAGIVIIGVSLAVLLVGTAGVEFFLMRTSLIGVLAGLVVFFAGWLWLRVLFFPLAFLLLMIPLPAIVFYQIAFPLQLLAARFGVTVLEMASIPVLREGNVIVLARTTLEVVEACSGIRSIISLLTLAVLYGYFSASGTGIRAVIALSSVPIAVMANGLRIAGTGIAAHHMGPSAATGFFHTFSSTGVFIVSLLMLFLMTAALKTLARLSPVSRLELSQS
jgi:exosortase